MDAYLSLDPDEIVATAERLSRRICERFPHSGLAGQKIMILQAELDAPASGP